MDSEIRVLHACAALRKLTLNCIKLTDAAIIAISRTCRALESIDFAGCSRLGDESIVALAVNATNLRSLNISMCHRVTDRSILALADRPNQSLERVAVDKCMKVSGSSANQGGVRLCPMSVSMRQVTGVSICLLIYRQSSMRSLSFAHCPKAADADFALLRRVPPRGAARLEELTVRGCALLGDQGVEALLLPHVTSLVALHAGSLLNASSLAFGAMAKCKRLRRLNLSLCRQVSNADVVAIAAHCAQLETLVLQACVNIDDSALVGIATHARHLVALSIDFCYNATDRGVLAVVKCCKTLEDLNVRACNQLTRATFDGLVALKTPAHPLRRLQIGACANHETTVKYVRIIQERFPRCWIRWT